jgi:large subunit ribosomal protein L4
VDDLQLKKISTKAFAKDLAAIKAEGKVLVVVPAKGDNLVKSAQNMASVTLRAVDNISVYDVLDATNIVITKEDIKTLEGGLQ